MARCAPLFQPRSLFRQHRVTSHTGGTGWEAWRVRNGGDMRADPRGGGESPAEAARPRPARRRGARSSPARRALSPAGGRGRPRTVPALRAGPLPAARSATAFVRPNWGGVSSITPAPARQRSWSAGRGRLASWLPGPGGAGAPRGGGAGGQGSRSRRSAARPPLLRGGSRLSAARGPPTPAGVTEGEGVLGRRLAGGPALSRRTPSRRSTRHLRPPLGVPPPHPTSC